MSEPARILVVDDEKRAVELLARTLRKTGKVDRALSGEEGMELIRRNDYHVVISDQRMPGLSGVDVLSLAAERNENCGRILLTGYSDLDATVAAINRGRVHAYLHKPCAPPDLLMVVGNVLERMRLARENERLVAAMTEQNLELRTALDALDGAHARALASERLAAIGKMIAMVVHDLRTPISLIHAAGAAAAREGEAHKLEEIHELAGEIVGESDRMRRMCDELLAVTRATEGGASLEVSDLDESLESTLAQLGGEADERGVTFELDLAAACRVRLDADRWRRVVENLVRNALEAIPAGGRVRIASRADGDRARVLVSDDGPGVPPEIAHTLFEPFTTAGKSGGTGLGLAIVRKLVEDHGGRIQLLEGAERGASFEILLPLDGAA